MFYIVLFDFLRNVMSRISHLSSC